MWIFQIVTFYVELIKLYLVITGLLSYKIISYKRFCLSVLIGTGLNILCIYQNIISMVYISGIIAMIIMAVNITNKKQIINKCLLILITYWFICLVDAVFGMIIMLMNGTEEKQIMQNDNYALFINSVGIVIYSFMVLIKKVSGFGDGQRKKSIFITSRNMVVILFIVISSGLYIAPLVILGFSESTVKSKKLIVLATSFLSVCFIFIVFHYFIQREEKRQLEKNMYLSEKIYKSREKYYKMLMNKNMQTIEFRHDIRNHLYCMEILLKEKKYDELDRYFEALLGKVQIIQKKVSVGNELVNAIIEDETGECRDIELTIHGLLPDELNIKNIDLCTIFSNIFKNAIEAVSKVTDHKWIILELKVLHTFLYIILENPVQEDMIVTNNKLLTSKQDKINHGIGSKNVLNCVKGYDGTVSYKCKDKVFRCEIIIPNIFEIK